LLKSAAGGTPAPVLSTSNVAGNAGTYLRTNDQLALFDTTVPKHMSSVGVVGTGAFASRVDHQHPSGASKTGLRIWDDFLYSATTTPTQGLAVGPLNIYFSVGSVLMSQIFGTPNHPGIVTLSTLTSSSSIAGIIGSGAQIVFGGGRVRFGAWVQVPVLSTGSERFEAKVGFFSTPVLAASVVDGAFFSYREDVNSGAWSVTTVANSVKTATTTVTTGVSPSAGGWNFLELEVNAAGNSITYYVDGVSTVTHTTNIPVGAGRETGPGMLMTKVVGTTARLFHIDAYYMELDFTTAR
jgi:hypothetical protein